MAVMASERALAVDRATVDLLYANARSGELITVGVAAALALVQWPSVGAMPAVCWLLAMLTITAARNTLRRAYLRRSNITRDLTLWRRAFAFSAGCTGLGWGAAGLILIPSAELNDAFAVVMVIAGMVSAAVPYLAPVLAAFNAYAIGAAAPVAARFFVAGDNLHLSVALLMLVYLAGIMRSAYLFGQSLRQAHELAHDEAVQGRILSATTQALEAANARLHGENERRLQLERRRRELETQTNTALAVLVDARTAKLQEALAAMTTTREQLDSALVAGRLALFDVDIETREVRLSVHWSQMLGGTAVETITTMRDLMLLTHPDDRATIARAYRAAIKGQLGGYVVDHRVSDNQGRWLWIESRARVTARRPNGATLKMVGTNCDISERKENEARLLFQAYHDPLTGLANRSFLRDRLQEMIYRADRMHRSLAVLCLDLDHFKYINDSDGHAAGDQLLCLAAERLTQCVRQADVVARLGGDEFAILLDGPLSTEDIAAAARKILTHINEPIRFDDHEYRLSTSIGVSCYPADGGNADELMTRADIAMYSAKESGRNDFRFFTSELNTEIHEKALLMAGLASAIAHGELSLVYQPRIDCVTGDVVSVEALLRWRHSEMGDIEPARFIPLAEQTGVIVTIGEWVLHEACAQMRVWRANGTRLRHVAVNLSMRQLLQEDLVDRIAAILHTHRLEPTSLELEITESMAMQAPDTVLTTLTALHELGVRIALDDFGTGYSSLSHLKRFPIDDLKIDRAFVRGVPGDAEDAAITRAILALARSLGLTPIAEGVETERQREFLLREGCTDMQGYLYGRPVREEELRLPAP